ncbi:MAG: T9SS type A sorting domain-containing protein [candidate division WOR-3 bacterium]|nr:T9SS type A sorting domain-containing protein [candidate division WOR-3 bacterium]
MKKNIFILTFLLFVGLANAEPIKDWCGTAQALEDFRQGKLQNRPTLSGPVEYIERPLFRIHYTRQGVDAVSVAYAESTASALQYSWTRLVDSLGWLPPPPDFGLGGDNRYDVYIKQLSSGIAGVTYPEYSYTNPYPNGVSSHFRITVGLDANGLKGTVCHEFVHAIEFRYSSAEGTWWLENCAVWGTEVVYDEVNDYLDFLGTSPNPLDSPHLPITSSTNLYWYAGGIWPMFLSEYYGSDCVRQMWMYQGQISGQNTLSGIDYVLTFQYGSNLATALKLYAVWRYFTGIRADTINFYKEGHLMPSVRILRTHNSYPATGDQGNYPVSNNGGTNYVQFLNGGGKLLVNFNAQSLYRWACFVVAYRPNSLSTVYELTLNSQANGSDSFPWQNIDHFALIPVLTQWEYATGNLPFSYSASIRILHDVGIERLIGFSAMVDSGTVINPQAMVKNYGLNSESFAVKLTIGDYYSNIRNISLNSGDSSLISFPVCTLRIRNYHAYKCTTLLAQDERPNNDCISGQTFVRVKDAGATLIIEPPANIIQGSSIQPKAMVKNYGNIAEIFDIEFTIGNWRTIKRTRIGAGIEIEVVFDSIWFASDTGYYVVKCSTKMVNDVDPNNDRVIASTYVAPTAIAEENRIDNLSATIIPTVLFNNRPIYLSPIRQNSDLEIELFNMQGSRVYYQKLKGNYFVIDNLPTGCYILRLKEVNKILSYKTIVIKN